MKQYEVIDVYVTFGIGMVLKLNDQQATTRAHALAKKHGGLFMVKSPVQFKRGEVIGVVVKGQLSRSLETRLRLIEPKKAKQPKNQNKEAHMDKATKATHSKKLTQTQSESINNTQSSPTSS